MRTLFVSAWWPELRGLCERICALDASPDGLGPGQFWVSLSGRSLFACTGIGMVAAAETVTRILCEHPSIVRVVFCATAGHYDAQVPLGKAFVSFNSLNTDAGVVLGRSYLPPHRGLFESVECPIEDRRVFDAEPFSQATCVCTPSITLDPELAKLFAAIGDLENLELHGVALAAQRAGKPWMACLGVSNSVGPDAHAQWKAWHVRASHAAQELAFQAAMSGGVGGSVPSPSGE